jgi:hypothetical protein
VIKHSESNELALLSLYAFRQMDIIDWKPFVKTALERNPVSLIGLKGKSAEEAYQLISHLDNDSIYDAKRIAQPDEIWNFNRGDGVEKGFLLANYLYNELHESNLNLRIENDIVILETQQKKFTFVSSKELVKKVNIGEVMLELKGI